jgi:hypothetical protein
LVAAAVPFRATNALEVEKVIVQVERISCQVLAHAPVTGARKTSGNMFYNVGYNEEGFH